MVLINIIREKVIYLLILTITFTCGLLFHYDYIQVDFRSILLITSPFVVVGIIVLISNLIIRGIDIPSEVKYKIIFGFYYHEDRSEYQLFVNNLMSKHDNEFGDHIKIRRFLGFTSASFIVFMMCYIIGPVLGFIKLFALAIEEYYVFNQIILIVFAVLLILISTSVFNLLFPKFVHANAWSIIDNTNGLYFKLPTAAEKNLPFSEVLIKEKESKSTSNTNSNFNNKEQTIVKPSFEEIFTKPYLDLAPSIYQHLADLGYFCGDNWLHLKLYNARFIYEEFVELKVMRDVGDAGAARYFNAKFGINEDTFKCKKGDNSPIRKAQRQVVKTDLQFILAKLRLPEFNK